jgi:hypothetical protein
MAESSFYGDTPNYATDYPTQNDSNTNPVTGNTVAPSSFYPNGEQYEEADPAAAANFATQAAASAAASAASAAAAVTTLSSALLKANNLSDLTNVATAKTNLSLVKADVGLGNVDNTSDANKPVSTAQATADALKANIASPTFTGVPAAPTATAGTNTTQLATTAFVLANAPVTPPATANPLMDGTVAVGVATKYAREDHRHPTDTSRAPVVSQALGATANFNTAVTDGCWYTIDASSTNAPSTGRYWYLDVTAYAADPTNYVRQTATTLDDAVAPNTYTREKVAGVWQPWQQFSFAKKNYIINGAMMVSQENGTTAGTPSGYYPADMFLASFVNDGAITCQNLLSVTANGSPNRLHFQVTTADTSMSAAQYAALATNIEGLRFADLLYGFAGTAKTATLKFGVRAPAGTYSIAFRNAAHTRAYVAEYTISGGEANIDVYKSVTIPGDQTGTWLTTNGVGLEIWFTLAAGSTWFATPGSWIASGAIASSNQFNLMGTVGNIFQLFDVGLYEGLTAPTFVVPDFASELLACSRYFTSDFPHGTPPADNVQKHTTAGFSYIANAFISQRCEFVLPMRVTPTMTIYAANNTVGGGSGTAGQWQYYSAAGAWTNASGCAFIPDALGFTMGGTSTMTNSGGWMLAGSWKANARL